MTHGCRPHWLESTRLEPLPPRASYRPPKRASKKTTAGGQSGRSALFITKFRRYEWRGYSESKHVSFVGEQYDGCDRQVSVRLENGCVTEGGRS